MTGQAGGKEEEGNDCVSTQYITLNNIIKTIVSGINVTIYRNNMKVNQH